MKSLLDFLVRLGRVWPYFKGGKNAWLITLLAVTVGAFTEPLIPLLLQPLLDQGFRRDSFNIWIVPVALVLLFGVRGLAGFVAQVALSSFTQRGLLCFRRSMFAKVLQAKLGIFDRQSSSSLTNTIVYEVYNGSSMLTHSLMGLLKDTLTLFALIAYLLFSNWKLTLIIAFLFPAVVFVMRILSSRLYRLTKVSQKATDDLAYIVEENVLAHRDIRLQSAQDSQLQRFGLVSQVLLRLSMKSSIAAAAMTPITQMLAAVALSAVISIALLQSSATAGAASVGSFVAFITAMLMLVAPIKRLSEIASPITRGLAALERGLELMELTEDEMSGSFSKPRASGNIDFKDVTVVYKEGGVAAVEGLNLTIAAGETVALVGASGSGKTTLANLLPRFVDVAAGHVILDGQDVRQWQLASLRSQLAIVSQHVVLLNTSVFENVTLGLPADRDKALQCIRAANLDQLIEDLPDGIDTVLGHNAMQLSGGQRQRLAIARALYKDAPILILDEATSALDTESEQAVQEAIKKLTVNRTSLIIAHRLATVQHADRIIMMNAGRIIETGSHQQLLAQNSAYAHLYRLGLNAD
jgi:subfamily B ATP-binding cassette protein MsbA